jgi:hypothetical protein
LYLRKIIYSRIKLINHDIDELLESVTTEQIEDLNNLLDNHYETVLIIVSDATTRDAINLEEYSEAIVSFSSFSSRTLAMSKDDDIPNIVSILDFIILYDATRDSILKVKTMLNSSDNNNCKVIALNIKEVNYKNPRTIIANTLGIEDDDIVEINNVKELKSYLYDKN